MSLLSLWRLAAVLNLIPVFLLCNTHSARIQPGTRTVYKYSCRLRPAAASGSQAIDEVAYAQRGIPGSPAFLTKGLRSRNWDSKVLPRASIAPLPAANKNRAPDLSSTLLSERTVFIGLPIQSVVAHLVISQLLYLDNVSQEPIKIYINCSDYEAQEESNSRPEVYALNIVDVMRYIKSDLVTVNLGKAYGPAALVLAAGTAGKRFVLPRSFTALRQLPTALEMMQAEDLSIYSREIINSRKDLVKELAKCCNKPESTLMEAIQRGSYLDAEETIAYGLADKVLANPNVELKPSS